MGYVVLSGKMHVDKHDTTFTTPASKLVCSTLSLMWTFLRCEQKQIVKAYNYTVICKKKNRISAEISFTDSWWLWKSCGTYQEIQVVGHIVEQPSNHCCQVDHMCRVIFVKQGFCLATITASKQTSKQLYYHFASATPVKNSMENLIMSLNSPFYPVCLSSTT
jgi:hypothetical protein